MHESNDILFHNSSNNKYSAEKLNESTSILMQSTSDLIYHNKELINLNDNTFNEFARFEGLVIDLADNLKNISNISTEIKISSINSSIEAQRFGEVRKGFRTISK